MKMVNKKLEQLIGNYAVDYNREVRWKFRSQENNFCNLVIRQKTLQFFNMGKQIKSVDSKTNK